MENQQKEYPRMEFPEGVASGTPWRTAAPRGPAGMILDFGAVNGIVAQLLGADAVLRQNVLDSKRRDRPRSRKTATDDITLA